ncbi:hypothetical protein I317_03959 [Kwoniella heveanensis CBS 569]|uniref:RRM domain-containing protein n=1 Tax=Kwoniella heveanensis BCC8398 TaxID=1296120 RepID=A0A1B9H415_9TREE|nr:hypothetical protein I316_00222 [Kwoniella heveanensis BCC8398]OCF42224.1 hypothetical protein I317_03959 [Kwoniella heveanensis CBS 569]
MAYNYSNPYQSSSSASSRVQSSAAITSQARQILFSGLPVDIKEGDLRDLLTADPLRLSPVTTSVHCFCDSTGRFNGVALIYVATAADAERVRVTYSGQQIDGTYTLSVSHVLPSEQGINPAGQPVSSSVTSRIQPAKPAAQPAKANGSGKINAAVPKGPKADNKPAGLQLLARLSKPGQTKDKQSALLERQKANLAKKGSAGNALLSRLQSSPAGHASKTKGKTQRLSTGTAKVGRAKANASKDGMDIDKPVVSQPKKEKPKQKTQAELDEEMRAYERARRFA